MSRFRTGLAIGSLLLLAASPSARRAGAAEPGGEGAGEASISDILLRLEEHIVTPHKKPEKLEDVPVGLTTISGDDVRLFTSGGGDLRVLSSRVPNLQIESSFGRTFPRLYIRGYGNTDFELNSSQPVSFVYDDVVQESPILKGFPLFDVEQIEVLRGPQGTLFGRNTPAGILKVDTRRPTSETEGEASLVYGTFDGVSFEGAFNFAFSDGLSARVSTMYQRRDDWVDNGFPGPRDAFGGYAEGALRLQLAYDSGEGLAALLNLHGMSLDGTSRLFRANSIGRGDNHFDPSFDVDTVFHDGDNEQELDTAGGALHLDWRALRGTITSITAFETADVYSRGDIDGGFGATFAPPSGPGEIPFPSETAGALPEHGQWTQETRYATDDWGKVDFLAGVHYFDEHVVVDTLSYDTLAGGVRDGLSRQVQDNVAWALFATVDLEATETTNVRAGARYTDEEKDYRADRLQSPSGTLGPLTAHPDDARTSWDLSAIQELGDDVNVYARVATGYRAPSIQGRILFGDTLSVADAETILSWEAGLKSTLLHDRLRINVAAFSYTVEDQQLTAVGGASNFTMLVNADETHGRGFEIDLEALPARDLRLEAGIGYVHTEIDDPRLAVQACGGGCTMLDPPGPVPGTVLIDGNRLPQAPRLTANATIRWSHPLGAGDFSALLDWYYRDEVSIFLYESAEFVADDLTEVGLRLAWSWHDGDHTLAVIGRNLTDEVEIVGAIDFNNLTGFVNDDPRFVGLQYVGRF